MNKNSQPLKLKYKLLILPLFLIGFLQIAHAETSTSSQNVSRSVGEIAESANCCYGSGISYCDATAGHYVCKNGDYSACICTNTTPVSTYRQLALGCCLWHGGVIASSLGQVVCADGSLSEVCSTQTNTVIAGSMTL